jgi:hypothetical protein
MNNVDPIIQTPRQITAKSGEPLRQIEEQFEKRSLVDHEGRKDLPHRHRAHLP